MFDIVFRYDPDQSAPPDRPGNAEEAIVRLAEGNEQFARL
jgi:hypothetical protein